MDTRLFQCPLFHIRTWPRMQRLQAKANSSTISAASDATIILCGVQVIQRITQYEKEHKSMGKIYLSIVFHGHITIMRLVSTHDFLVKV